MYGSLLLNDRTICGVTNDLPKSMTLLYFVTSTFGEFDAMELPSPEEELHQSRLGVDPMDEGTPEYSRSVARVTSRWGFGSRFSR
jgi:hypothetical protein